MGTSVLEAAWNNNIDIEGACVKAPWRALLAMLFSAKKISISLTIRRRKQEDLLDLAWGRAFNFETWMSNHHYRSTGWRCVPASSPPTTRCEKVDLLANYKQNSLWRFPRWGGSSCFSNWAVLTVLILSNVVKQSSAYKGAQNFLGPRGESLHYRRAVHIAYAACFRRYPEATCQLLISFFYTA